MGDINPFIVKTRLEALVQALPPFQKGGIGSDGIPARFLELFPTTIGDRLDLSEDMMDKWMQKFFSVTINIGSRIKLPCDAVLKRYRHTIEENP